MAPIKTHAVSLKDLKRSKRKGSTKTIKLKGASSKPTTDNQEALKSDLSAKRNGRRRAPKTEKDKSLEQWIWDGACSIRGAKDAPKYKEYILPLIFTKRLCDVFDDEVNRIAEEVGSRDKAFKLIESD
jgi:type I restriction enzyme M protein